MIDESLIEHLKTETDLLWKGLPEEISKLTRSHGTLNTYASMLLYQESESRELVEYLFQFRKMVKEKPGLLESLKFIARHLLEYKADKWIRYFMIQNTPKLMKDTASSLDAVTTSEEYVKLLNAILQYINIWNYRMDLEIPWNAISTVYDWVVLGKDTPKPT